MAPLDFDESDLTEFDDSGDDVESDVPLAKSQPKASSAAAKGKGKAKAQTEYTILKQLTPPRTTQYSAQTLYDQIIDNTVDLDPEYQRDVVWPESKQSGLIDSILRHYYMPPIIFAVDVNPDDGSVMRTCIDGKQRLTSIHRFMDGLIPYKDSVTGQKFWYKPQKTAGRKVLPDTLRKKFAKRQIVVVEYDNLSDDEQREMFQRVQLGMALTPAERLQALTGPWPSIVRDIQAAVFSDDGEGFNGHLDWASSRGRDFQSIAAIAYLIDKKDATRKIYPGTATLETWLSQSKDAPSQFVKGLRDTFRVYVKLVHTFPKTFHANKTSPVEFIMIGLLVYHYRTRCSLVQLDSAVKKLRADVRSKHTDIRQNTKVTKDIFAFIYGKIKISELKCDNEGNIPASSSTKSASGNKRKRDSYTSDDSSDSPPAPKGKATPVAKKPSLAKKVTAAEPSSSKLAAKSKAIAPKTPSSSAVTEPIRPYQAIKRTGTPKPKPPNSAPATRPPDVRPEFSLPPTPTVSQHVPQSGAFLQSSQQPYVQTSFDHSQQHQPWSQNANGMAPTSLPGRMPMTSAHVRTNVGISPVPSPNIPYTDQRIPSNGFMSGPTPTPPTSHHTPAFVQNLNNPLHGQSSQNGYGVHYTASQPPSNLGMPPIQNGSNYAHLPPAHPSLPPPPHSGTSTSSGFPHPPTSASSTGSSSQWPSHDRRHLSDPDLDQIIDRYSRPPPRDPRIAEPSRGRSYDGRPPGYPSHRGWRERERDGGWGSRGRGRGAPSSDR